MFAKACFVLFVFLKLFFSTVMAEADIGKHIIGHTIHILVSCHFVFDWVDPDCLQSVSCHTWFVSSNNWSVYDLDLDV